MTFRQLCLSVSTVFFILCLTLAVTPHIIYWLFDIDSNDLGDFLAKRAGVLFLGLSLLCFHARASTSDEVRSLVSFAVGSSMAAMAVLGVYEFSRATVGAGIWVAITAEATIAALFLLQWRQCRIKPDQS